jgi:hypothetical protein
MTAHQESDESEDRQNQVRCHVPRLFADIPFRVNFLPADGIMANYRLLKLYPCRQGKVDLALASSQGVIPVTGRVLSVNHSDPVQGTLDLFYKRRQPGLTTG